MVAAHEIRIDKDFFLLQSPNSGEIHNKKQVSRMYKKRYHSKARALTAGTTRITFGSL